MKLFSLGFLAAIVLLAGGVYGFCALGFAPVSTKAAPLPFERQLTGMALRAREEREAPKSAAIQPTPEILADGSHLYVSNCALCHGFLGGQRSAIAAGMFPGAPQFFNRRRPGAFGGRGGPANAKKKAGRQLGPPPPGEMYWTIENGIRLTAMPSFRDSLTEQQIWEISLVMALDRDKLPPQVTSILQAPPDSPKPPSP